MCPLVSPLLEPLSVFEVCLFSIIGNGRTIEKQVYVKLSLFPKVRTRTPVSKRISLLRRICIRAVIGCITKTESIGFRCFKHWAVS